MASPHSFVNLQEVLFGNDRSIARTGSTTEDNDQQTQHFWVILVICHIIIP